MEKGWKNVNDYIIAQPVEVRVLLEKLRHIIKSNAPEAEEVFSYGMPGYKFHGMLMYFAAFKNHCSLFPGNATLINTFKEELQDYKTSRGTIQFTINNPLPASLVKKIVKIRRQENLSKIKQKLPAKKK